MRVATTAVLIVTAIATIGCQKAPPDSMPEDFRVSRTFPPQDIDDSGPAQNTGNQESHRNHSALEFTDCAPTRQLFTPPAGIEVSLSIPKTSFSAEEPVPLTLTVKNTSDKPIERKWTRDQQDREYWISTSEGTIWRWGYGDELFRGGAGSIVYEPGESNSFPPENWEQEVCLEGRRVVWDPTPGRFAALAYIVDNDHAWVSSRVEFEIR